MHTTAAATVLATHAWHPWFLFFPFFWLLFLVIVFVVLRRTVWRRGGCWGPYQAGRQGRWRCSVSAMPAVRSTRRSTGPVGP